jgi:excisionase family DNA binding protein
MSLLAALLDELRADPGARAELRELLDAGPAVYTPRTLAAELGITPRAIRAAIERGELEAVKSGRGYVIAREAVARFAASSTTRVPTAPRKARARPLRDAMDGIEDRA